MVPPLWYASQSFEERLEGITGVINATKPEQIAVQIDPMPFLYKARQFGIENLPSTQETLRKSQMGVFGQETNERGESIADDLTEEDREAERKIEEQRYNYMFPVQWQESNVSSAIVMLLAGHFQQTKDAQYFVQSLMDEKSGVSEQEHEKLMNLLMKSSMESIFTNQSPSKYFQLNDIVLYLLLLGQDVTLIDMPELLLRMKIGSMYSLDELNKIFNSILNRVSNPRDPYDLCDKAALAYFPHVFAAPRDEYVTAMLFEMANDNSSETQSGLESILAFTGNCTVKPAKRIWGQVCKNGHAPIGVPGRGDQEEQGPHKPIMKNKKSVLLRNQQKKKAKPFVLDYMKAAQMQFNIEEPAEEKIAK